MDCTVEQFHKTFFGAAHSFGRWLFTMFGMQAVYAIQICNRMTTWFSICGENVQLIHLKPICHCMRHGNGWILAVIVVVVSFFSLSFCSGVDCANWLIDICACWCAFYRNRSKNYHTDGARHLNWYLLISSLMLMVQSFWWCFKKPGGFGKYTRTHKMSISSLHYNRCVYTTHTHIQYQQTTLILTISSNIADCLYCGIDNRQRVRGEVLMDFVLLLLFCLAAWLAGCIYECSTSLLPPSFIPIIHCAVRLFVVNFAFAVQTM